MRQVLSRTEYMQWLAYFKYKQPDIQELQMAVLSTIVVNAVSSKSKAKVDDFIISHKHVPKVKKQGMSESEVRSSFAGFATKKM